MCPTSNCPRYIRIDHVEIKEGIITKPKFPPP
jgi:hypothetical protein